MNARPTRAAALALAALAGCATRAELVQQDHQLRTILQDQRKQLQEVQKEVERLRADIEEGHPRRSGGGGAGDDRLSALEQRLADLERGTGSGGLPPAATPPSGSPAPPSATASAPPAGSRPPAATPDDEWRQEIAREQKAAGTLNVPERAEYLTLLDGLARQDCARTVPQLNSFAANHKESRLADHALFWAARCYALRGDQNQAVTKFYDVVTKYPKGDKAAAALWAQGNLFVEMGDSPDARL
ncbi:MAG: tetratricopeptide repeat protein, partial [Deltaproteobacteria bacterium]